MTQPNELIAPRATAARLVTKTSLPNPKQAIALFVILWYANGKPAWIEYGRDEGPKAQGGIIDEDIVRSVKQFLDANSIDTKEADVAEHVAKNKLVLSQIESLNAAFELIWHLGRFTFADTSKNLAAERKGGLRFRKRIDFTTNMDILDMIIEPYFKAAAAVLAGWLTGGTISGEAEVDVKIARTLSVFAETSYYKTSKGETGRVFAPSGIYDTLIQGTNEVEVTDAGAETQGPTRILKAAIGDGLNPLLAISGDKVILNSAVTNTGMFANYAERAKTTISLSRIEVETGTKDEMSEDDASTEEKSDQRNLIYFGAPGTGKSYQLNELAIGNKKKGVVGRFDEGKVRRVTFHPDYTYSQFVGCYKPYTDANNEIGYKYVAGPFLETYLDAIAHPGQEYLLLIEELNRANPAAVFGDVFQLLDRDDFGHSEYPVDVSEEMAGCIEEYCAKLDSAEREAIESFYDPDMDFVDFVALAKDSLAIPENMFIWATMNSADQGVFPMDTAFKRRWDFHYIDIDEGQGVIADKAVPLGKTGRLVLWNDLRHAINEILKGKVNEDKLLGPFFIAPSILDDHDHFEDVFESKVLLYLYEDAAKTKRRDVFKNGSDITYSELCERYRAEGEGAFADGFKRLKDYGTAIADSDDDEEAEDD